MGCKHGQINDMPRGWSVKNRENKWLWRCWYDMFIRVNEYENYSDVTIEEDFKYLSKYVCYIQSLPRYELAKSQNFDRWTIDKDVSGSRHYGYGTISLMTIGEQSCERNQRCGYPGKKQSKKVKGININDDHDVIYYNSSRDAERDGFDHSAIIKCCKGKYKYHKGYYWEYQ